MMSHALDYAAGGHEVFLVERGGKRPLSTHGMKDATTDLEQVRDQWVQHPEANIGIRPPAGYVIVDVDVKAGGPSALYELTRPYGGLIPTWTAHTGGGGLHAWYRAPGPYKGMLCQGVDLKGHSGYVVVPPSLHVSGKRYIWANDLPIADAPDWLVRLMRKPVAPLRPLRSLGGVAACRADDALVDVLKRARPGDARFGRNAALNWAAYRAAERGAPAATIGRLRRTALDVGLDADEIERTLASAAAAPHG